MDDLEEAVRTFLGAVDSSLEEYDAGYADADATLRRIESHVESLREDLE